MFWPLPDSLAFSDPLVGYAPAGLVGSGTHAAIARYDLLFLFAYALCFVGAYLLAPSPAARSRCHGGAEARASLIRTLPTDRQHGAHQPSVLPVR